MLGQFLAAHSTRPVSYEPFLVYAAQQELDLTRALFMPPSYGASAAGTKPSTAMGGGRKFPKLRREA